MPRVIRTLIDFSQGHCFQPRPCLTGSLNVFVNTLPVVRQSDNYGFNHSCGDKTHQMGVALEGSPTVFINGLGVHRDGDRITCGDVADNGSLDVLADEARTGGTGGNTVGYTVGLPILSYPYTDITLYSNFLVKCNKFYHTGEVFNGIKDIFPGDLFTPLNEEDTGNIIKDYTTPITNFKIFPNLPNFLSIDSATGSIKIVGDLINTLQTTYFISFENFVGENSVQINLGVQVAPPGFACQ